MTQIWKAAGYHILRFGDHPDVTDTDQQVITHISWEVLSRLLMFCQPCSLQNHNCHATRRGCDLRWKAIRAKAGMWPYKKELFRALLITWSTKCWEHLTRSLWDLIFFSIEFSAPMFKSQLVGSIHGQNLRQEDWQWNFTCANCIPLTGNIKNMCFVNYKL